MHFWAGIGNLNPNQHMDRDKIKPMKLKENRQYYVQININVANQGPRLKSVKEQSLVGDKRSLI